MTRRRKPSQELAESEDYWEIRVADSEERRLRKRVANTARREAGTPQEAQARRVRDNLAHTARREAETPQEAEARRLRDCISHTARREAETLQEAETRRLRDIELTWQGVKLKGPKSALCNKRYAVQMHRFALGITMACMYHSLQKAWTCCNRNKAGRKCCKKT